MTSAEPSPAVADHAVGAPVAGGPLDALVGQGLRLTDRRLRELGRPFRAATVASVTVRLAIAATRVAQALLIAKALGRVLHRHGQIGPSLILVGGLGLSRIVLVWVVERITAAHAAQVRRSLRALLYARLARLGPSYLAQHRTGQVETVLVGTVDQLGGYYAEFIPLAVASAISVVAVLAWIAVLDPLTAMVMVATAGLVPLAPVLTARAFGEHGRRVSAGLSRLGADYLDAIQGLVTLKAFNAADRCGERLDAANESLSEDATSLAGLANIHIGFVSLGMAAGMVLGVALATTRATHHSVALAALLAILLLARECFRPLGDLQASFPGAYDAAARANGVFDLLDAVDDTPSTARPAVVVVDPASVEPSIRFVDVTFSYLDDRAPALDRVTFAVAPGETVALVGASGAGKSTVVSLLLRFFDPASGSISIGGHDIRDLDIAALRSLISVTFQDSYLFHRSVADNLRLARPDASDADVEAAARAANAHEFVMALPDRYDTVVHERGARLSGGERQRLTIARALLADTPILVLDEPTSSVDSTSETLITEALARLNSRRTTLVIAHRLSTIATADRVVVLDHGRVVEVGRPELLRAGTGPFTRLIETQAQP